MIDDAAAAVEPSAGIETAPLPALAPTQRAHQSNGSSRIQITSGRRWWTATLALAVVVSAGGLALVYNDDLSSQSAERSLTTQNESLQGQILGLQGQLSASEGKLSSAQADLAAARAELTHPSLEIWNVSQTLANSSASLAAGIPDTFTYHLRLRSTGPMNVSILSTVQFAAAIKCIDNGVAVTDWCMHHSTSTIGWLGGTSVNYDFHLAEGCAGYLVVITAPHKVTVTPDVSITYNPAPHATGACR